MSQQCNYFGIKKTNFLTSEHIYTRKLKNGKMIVKLPKREENIAKNSQQNQPYPCYK